MKKILAFLILACLLVSVVSCIDTKKKDDENGTNAVVTDAEGSVVTDEKGDPETYRRIPKRRPKVNRAPAALKTAAQIPTMVTVL